MPQPSAMAAIRRLARELSGSAQGLPHLWGRRGLWQVRLRWAVAPITLAGVVLGRWLGFEFPLLPVLLIALASPLYNAVFAWIFTRWSGRLEREPQLDRLLAILQVIVDYLAMFLLIYFTGGTASPLVFFLLFHVIIAAIQFRPSTAYLFAGLACGGLWLLLTVQLLGWLPCHCLAWRGTPFCFLDRPAFAVVMLLFFSGTVLILATMATAVMGRLRGRVAALAEASGEVAALNDALNSLYAMVCAVGSERRLKPILDIVTSELARVVDVPAVAVKLLEEDGKTLRFVAAHGLTDEFLEKNAVHPAHSPLNRRILEGETLAYGGIDEEDAYRLDEDLVALGIQSAVLAPLRLEDRVIGSLGAYSHARGRFGERETNLLQLAAELVAIAIDNARAYAAIQDLMQERTKFMLEVAHNMRAPLGAGLSMLELLGGGYLGEVNEQQAEHIRRIDHRLRGLNQTIGELLTIARTRDRTREIPDVVVDMNRLAEHTERTFRAEAGRKGLRFEVHADGDLPSVDSGADLLEQLLENLVSNAFKYTPEGGEVEVRFTRRDPGEVRIMVRDTGIGIPAGEQAHLFKEFFRASNARKRDESGTGLGLALVKQTVERHNGRLHLASQEGEGTTVVVDLPTKQPAKG